VENDGTRMLFVGGEGEPEQGLCGLGASGEGGEGTAGREGRARLPGRPTRGKWWPLTRNSGGVSDALGSVWGFTCFCVCVELIYIGVLAFTPFFNPFWIIFEVLW
jgi:hypothetical protein